MDRRKKKDKRRGSQRASVCAHKSPTSIRGPLYCAPPLSAPHALRSVKQQICTLVPIVPNTSSGLISDTSPSYIGFTVGPVLAVLSMLGCVNDTAFILLPPLISNFR